MESQNLKKNPIPYSIAKRDRDTIWHPFTQEQIEDSRIEITRGEGSYIFDESNNKYLDLVSSWWVNLHGHSHPDIAESIYKQAKSLEHVIFAGFTHKPAVKLCEALSEILPQSLTRFFFSDNGSTAVEIALKMSFQYWQNKQEDRHLFLSFEGGYHGDTVGAMSLGQHSGFHNPFKKLMFEVLSLPFPATWDEDMSVEEKEKKCIEQLNNYLSNYSGKIAAIILEPIIQGAAGMRMCRPQFIKDLISIVRSHNILVIFDEVMTGFGRTGKTFALEHIGVEPDFLCLAKGITGGFLPLALTITSNEIYEAFLSDKWGKGFIHGHSYTANPIACAAAIKSLELLQKESCRSAIRDISEAQRHGLEYLKTSCDNILRPRQFGTIVSFEIDSKTPNLNRVMKRTFLDKGLLIRPIGNSIYLIPPYCIKVSELDSAYREIAKILGTL